MILSLKSTKFSKTPKKYEAPLWREIFIWESGIGTTSKTNKDILTLFYCKTKMQ